MKRAGKRMSVWVLCVVTAAAGLAGQARAAVPKVLEGVLDEGTIAVAGVRVAGVDAAALREKVLGWVPAGISEKDRQEAELALTGVAVMLAGWKTQLEAAGVEKVYVVVSVTDVPYLFGVVEGKALHEEALGQFVAMIGTALSEPLGWERIRGAMVVGPKATLDRLREREVVERPELAAAWEAAGRGDVQVAVIPPAYVFRVTEEMLPIVPVVERPATVVTRGARWASVAVDLPPGVGVGVRIGSDDAAAAAALEGLIGEVWGELLDRLPAELAELRPKFEEATEQLRPRAGGAGLALRLDEEKVDRIPTSLLQALWEREEARRASQ